MSLQAWVDAPTESDKFRNDFGRNYTRLDEGSALFGNQPHIVAHPAQRTSAVTPSPRFGPYSMFKTRRVPVFKNIASVPDITLNFAQCEAITPYGSDLAMSPLFSDFSSPSSSDSSGYTPSFSSTPSSINSDLSPITLRTPEQFLDPSPLRFSHPLSPLLSETLLLPDNLWDSSPISAPVDDLPCIHLFSESPKHPHSQFTSDDTFDVSSNGGLDAVVLLNNEVQFDELEASPKRQRQSPPEPESLPLPSSPSAQRRGRFSASKKYSKPRDTLVKTPRVKRTIARNEATGSGSKKFDFELSPDLWLKLTPPAAVKSESPPASHPTPPHSLSPSATPEVSHNRKRKLAAPTLTTPLPSPPLPRQPSLADDQGFLQLSPTSSKSNEDDEGEEKSDKVPVDYVARDFITAQSMAHRRSSRSKAIINYAGCDEEEDKPEKPLKSKTKPVGTIVQASHEAPRKPRLRISEKIPVIEGKYSCPFSTICDVKISRLHDVVRHLTNNVLHTHTEKTMWKCVCGTQLSRLDSFTRHRKTAACGKRSVPETVKPVYPPEVLEELRRIRNSDNPIVVAAKEMLVNTNVKWED